MWDGVVIEITPKCLKEFIAHARASDTTSQVPSSRDLQHGPLSAVTRVRIPLGLHDIPLVAGLIPAQTTVV
jgi:hypothetical protein